MAEAPASDGDGGARGFLNPGFAAVYGHLGTPLRLARSGGQLIRRSIPGTDRFDSMGCYPFFCCKNWDGLGADMEDMAASLVSLVLVSEPFFAPPRDGLERLFERVVPFKTHYLADLSRPLADYVTPSRQRKARRALRQVEIEIGPGTPQMAEDWLKLERALSGRHELTGMSSLPPEALMRLLALPGVVVLRATHGDETVGMHVEAQQQNVVYGHLAAYSELGYRLGAPTALHAAELEHFHGKAQWLDWGGVPGADESQGGGLAAFKRAFSTATRQVYLCGRIFDGRAYRELCAAAGAAGSAYFPAYRDGEFTGGPARHRPAA